MNKITIEPGRVVLSTAGRDAGRRFVVLGVEDAFARLADGSLRKAEAPKKKKCRHMRATQEFIPSIAEILKDGKLPSNAEIRRWLQDRPAREERDIGQG